MSNDSKTGSEWVVYRCWAGVASTMVPQETKHRFRSRHEAEQCADGLAAGFAGSGTWFEVRPSS